MADRAAGRFQNSPSKSSLIQPHTPQSPDGYYIGDVYERIIEPALYSRGFHAQEKGRQSFIYPSGHPQSDHGAIASKISTFDTNSRAGPYEERLREDSKLWPYLRYLADFMYTTCAPPKLHLLNDSDKLERANRVKVSSIHFRGGSQDVRRADYDNIEALEESLVKPWEAESSVRLYVVEDLSRSMIEAFGSALGVDPQFWRDQISDYLWYNTRDPWVELPQLESIHRDRSYFTFRYVQPRYFKSEESLARAKKETGAFNVLRRIDAERDGVLRLDAEGSVLGLIRSKGSIWIKPNDGGEHRGIIGILLLDPPIKEGFPLWAGYGNLGGWNGNSFQPSPLDIRSSIFESFLYWMTSMPPPEPSALQENPRLLVEKALILACGQWMLLLEYANTRIIQIEWQVEDSSLRNLGAGQQLETCLKRLHRWRRVLPSFLNMVARTRRAIEVPRSYQHNADHILGHLDSSGVQRGIPNLTTLPSFASSTTYTSSFPVASHSIVSPFSPLIRDLTEIQQQINSLQQRAERIVSLVATIISVEEAKKAAQQNSNLTRLTYLACVFIPLSYVASLFSMVPDLEQLKTTFWVYFAAAVPLTVLCFVITLTLYSDRRVLRGQKL